MKDQWVIVSIWTQSLGLIEDVWIEYKESTCLLIIVCDNMQNGPVVDSLI